MDGNGRCMKILIRVELKSMWMQINASSGMDHVPPQRNQGCTHLEQAQASQHERNSACESVLWHARRPEHMVPRPSVIRVQPCD